MWVVLGGWAGFAQRKISRRALDSKCLVPWEQGLPNRPRARPWGGGDPQAGVGEGWGIEVHPEAVGWQGVGVGIQLFPFSAL